MVVMSRRRVFLLALVAFLLIPAAALAGTLFSDVVDGSTHSKGIEFMKSSGVTLGCGDGTTYCPKDPVLREQMATFMYRLSGNDPATPPSVNADKLDGKDSTAFLQDATAFLGKTEKAADSERVDGYEASGLVRLEGGHVTADVDGWNGATLTETAAITAPSGGFLLVTYTVNLAEDADSTGAGSRVYNINPKLDGTQIGGLAWISLDFDADFLDTYATASLQRIVPVSAGDYSVTVDFQATSVSATALTYVFERSLSVLFVPFDGGGASVLGATSLGALSENVGDLGQ